MSVKVAKFREAHVGILGIVAENAKLGVMIFGDLGLSLRREGSARIFLGC
jgi:hypothetical protein